MRCVTLWGKGVTLWCKLVRSAVIGLGMGVMYRTRPRVGKRTVGKRPIADSQILILIRFRRHFEERLMTIRSFNAVGVGLALAMIGALAFSRFAVAQGMSDGWRDTPPAIIACLVLAWFVWGRRRARRERLIN